MINVPFYKIIFIMLIIKNLNNRLYKKQKYIIKIDLLIFFLIIININETF